MAFIHGAHVKLDFLFYKKTVTICIISVSRAVNIACRFNNRKGNVYISTTTNVT